MTNGGMDRGEWDSMNAEVRRAESEGGARLIEMETSPGKESAADGEGGFETRPYE